MTHDALSPLWQHTATPLAPGLAAGADAQPLAALGADTIVIGAGVTGLSVALHLAERGVRVAVLDQDGPGAGSTGRSNGQVIAGLQKPPDAVVAAHGAELGERMVELSGRAPELLFELVARHGIACDAERNGWVQATRSKRELDSLAKLVASWAARGAPVRMLDRREIESVLGTSAYAGGWVDQRGGTIQPLSFARGLAGAAAQAGATLRFGVRVESLARRNGLWHLATRHGGLDAQTVVLATNADTARIDGEVKALIGRSYLSAYSVQLASEPLDAARLRTLLPQRHACGDTSHVRLRYFRLDRDDRFVIGGPGWLRPPRSGRSTSLRVLERSARRMFPQLEGVRFEHRWAARDTLTPDLLPHLYEPCAGLFSALGYNGRGLAIGVAIGAVIARRVLGEDARTLPFPLTPPSRVPLNPLAAARFYARVLRTRSRLWVSR